MWKEKPKAYVQTSASVTANAGSRGSSGAANDFRGGNFALQASSVNPASDVSVNVVAGRAQPGQKFIPVESSVGVIGSSPDSKLSGLKTGVGGKPSIGPDSSKKLAVAKGQTGQKTLGVAKGYATNSGGNNGDQGKPPMIAMGETLSSSSNSAGQVGAKPLSATFGQNQTVEKEQSLKGPVVEDFVVDKRAFACSQIRATFYPKFENEKSDQEIRTKMIEMVSNGKGTLEVSLKHSGSLFMFAGHEGGAYAKNSYGNIYTAVGVFVLGWMLQETWGAQAASKQKEFNDFLHKNRMCISTELVTAVLGDHGQRPLQDYVVVTAVTELGAGKPRFYSTADIISFCRKWRLPTNSVWLFSTRKSVTSFFAVYDALCEEGTATPVCKALDEIADISVPGTKDHVKVQGEILEGLVARIVSSESATHLKKVLEEVPPPIIPEASCELGQGLREICRANNSSEQQQIKALLRSAGTAMCPDHTDWFGSGAADAMAKASERTLVLKFIQSHPADYATSKLQEMIQLMRQKKISS